MALQILLDELENFKNNTTMRKLASIQKINDLQPIPNADKIEVASIKGWKVVVKKGEFEIYDFCVFFEIDSLIPREPWNDFLADKNKPNAPIRLKTIKLKKQISQGLAIPIKTIFAQDQYELEFDQKLGLYTISCGPIYLKGGTDLTEFLGIEKWEAKIPVCLSGKIKGNFPYFVPKTEEERIQNIPEVLLKNKDVKVCVNEKMEGTSLTCYLNNNEFGVCSRNIDLLEEKDNTLWKIAKELDIENKLRKYKAKHGFNIAIQGELVGESIQGNIYKLKGQTVFLFNVFNIDKQEYMGYDDFFQATIELNLQRVPNIFVGKLKDIIDVSSEQAALQDILDYSTGKSILNKKQEREGIVVRNFANQKDLSFKAANNRFLLKNG